MIEAVKFADGSDDMLEGIGIPFGGPWAGGNDIYGEHFSAKTDFALNWFSERPALFHHGLDSDAGVGVVGRVKAHEVKADIGVWTKVQLDKSSEYFAAIKDLVKAGKLFFSSGAMAHLVDVDKRSGEIKRWPWVELSLTPTPANLLATVDFATASRHYKSAGLELPEALRAELDAEARQQLSDDDFAYIDAEGGRHLPINDKAHVQAAMARFNQTAFESDAAKAKARARILAAAEKMGMEVSGDAMKAVTMEQMRQLVADLEMDMTPADMQKMVDAFPNHDEAAMRKALAARKQMGKSADHSTYVAWRGQGILATKQVNEDAFWSHVAKGDADNAHWIWTGAKNTKGYGILEVDGETVRAHRVAYEMAHGAIPDGKDVGHKSSCATTSCVRAAHLELVTNDENAQERANRKGVPTFSEFVNVILGDSGLDAEPVPIGLHAEAIMTMAASLAERTKGLHQRRLKEGRMISDANRKRLMQCMDQMGAAMAEMQTLLDSSAVMPKETKDLTAKTALRRLRAQLVAQSISAMALN